MSNHFSQSRLPVILWSIALISIIGAVTAGLIATGGPAQQRKERLDADRSGDLAAIQRRVEDYYRDRQQLPESLQALEQKMSEETLRDPATGIPYQYEKTDAQTFKLCATFETDTRHGRKRAERYYGPDESRAYRHPQGPYCFTLRNTQGEAGSKAYSRFRWEEF